MSALSLRLSPLRVQFAAAASIFLVNGIMIGAWVARIPVVATQTHLDEQGLGFAFIFGTAGAVLTMGVGGWLGGKLGSHVMAPLATVTCGASLILIGLAWDFWSLVFALLCFGITQGTMDVMMNANGVAVERAGAGPIISRLHAMWSIGAFLGALISTQAAALGVTVLPEFAAVFVVVALAAAVMTRTLIHDKHVGDGPSFRLPSGRLLLVGALCAAGLLSETSATDWSGMYLSRDMHVDPGLAGLGVTIFTGCMAIARLVGDRLTMAIGTPRLVAGGSAMAAVGLVLALGPQWLPAAMVGYALIGLGLAGVVPSYFRAGGNQPGVPSSVGIAAVSTMGYAGGMIGPPVIGSLGGAFSLRASLLILLALMIVLVILSPRALAGTPPTEGAEAAETGTRTAEA
jgi:MFS family permease